MQFQTHVKCELQMIRDGNWTMMHEVAFIAWSAKPKNWPPLGLSQEQAKNEFQRRLELPDTIIDEKGPFNGKFLL